MLKRYVIAVLVFWGVLFIARCLPAASLLQQKYEEGMLAYQSGNYAEAIRALEEAVEINSNFAPLYNALGLAHYKHKSELSEVMWFFKVAVDIDPDYAEAYGNMCRIYSQVAKFDEAEDACLKALEVDPGFLNARLSLAWLYLIGKPQPDRAIEYFQEVLKEVQFPMVYFGLGMAYSRKGDNAKVLETITTLRGLGEDDLAVQLEAAIRKDIVPFPIEDVQSGMPGKQPGTIVPVRQQQQRLQDPSERYYSSEPIRIRLKGKLYPSAVGPKEVSDGQARHPGSL